MSTQALRAGWKAARARRRAIVFGFGLPLALLPAALLWRWGLVQWLLPALTLGLLLLATLAVVYARRLDRRWLQRRLDGYPQMQDSADLWFTAFDTLGPLQRLQYQRLQPCVAALARQLREPWPWRRGLLLLLSGCTLLALLIGWPRTTPVAAAAGAPKPVHSTAAPLTPRLQQVRVQATPPAYTGLPVVEVASLDLRQPEGTQLRWNLRFAPQPEQVQLLLHDGTQLALQRQDQQWTTQLQLQRSGVYRLRVDGVTDNQQLYRLEALPDRPPQLRVISPETSLVQWEPASGQWSLQFTASDDYGVAADAQLQLTLAQGSGENIRFHQHSINVTGSGSPQQRRFSHRLQPQALGMAAGDDLVAQLIVRDNHQPQAQYARSPSVILRWPPPEQTRRSELEGSVKQALPAYFRSQRQIIIDAEALLQRQRQMDAPQFVTRSDAIGVDQRLLRLRYGQFLGEESQRAPQLPVADELPVADASAAEPVSSAAAGHSDAAHAHRPAPEVQGAAALDTHAHDHAQQPAGFGEQADVLATFGHTHDHAEAATLLDPHTRATLKAALEQMWQSERELRQGQPARALPFAYKALGFIKQVQQAERIYLPRTGAQLPPIDPSRRMQGARDGLGAGGDVLRAGTPPDPQPMVLWQALAADGEDLDGTALTGFSQWLAQHAAHIDDALELSAALESVRGRPDCAPCRQRLRAQLWPLLSRPASALAPRPPLSASGKRYLDALQRQQAER